MSNARFSSAKDMEDCKNYCDRIFYDRKAQPTIDYLSLKISLEPNSTPEECLEFWDSFLSVIASTYHSKTIEDLRPGFPWGCWQLSDTGEKDHLPTLWKGSVSRHDGGAYQIHTYDKPLTPSDPPESNLGDNFDEDGRIIWELLVAKQQGRDVLVGAVTVGEIDAVCKVPHLPNFAATNQGSRMLAEWSMNPKKGLSKWQRRPDAKRIKSISNFMDTSDDNLIINSIMLYIPKKAKGVEIQKHGKFAKIIIDPKKFLAPKQNKLTDVTIKKSEENGLTYKDHRPIWIVDGQHRTRGMALSHRGARLDVPVIVTHGGGEDTIELEEVAKIFTEINTLANPLDNKQQHYLSHKFSIVSSDKDKTYGPPSEGLNDKDTVNRLANIRMYKLASMLTMEKGGPFENGVQLVQGQGSAMMSRITIEEFTKQMRPLFINGIYSDPNLTINEIYDDFSAYLSAWSNTANHHKWNYQPNKKRWEPNRSNSSELESSQAIVWIIFKPFTFIRNVALTRGMPLNEDTYTEILAPIRGIDWYSRELASRFFKQYRPASEYMSIWIKQAIINGSIRTPDEVASFEETDVDHGTALYAIPSSPEITYNHGALSTSIILTWKHGNVYKKPEECHLITNTLRTQIDDVEWNFEVPDGLSDETGIAVYTINVDNDLLVEDNWKIIVNTRCIKATREIEITSETLTL